jgi:hypothetical protein
VDPLIHKYLAEEFCEATTELDKIRDHLQFNEQVLQSDMISRAVTDWQKVK